MPHSVKDIPLFRGLSTEELETLAQCLKEKSFAKGETLFLEGAGCDRIFFVQTGRVKVYRVGASGKEQTLQTLGPGDTCACNPGSTEWTCSSTAVAATDSVVWYLSKEKYVRLVQANDRVARTLNRILADRLQCLGALVEDIALKTSDKRLVKFLLDLHESNTDPKKSVLSLPFTREELAQRIGTARETVARQLYSLKRKKLIDIRSHQVVILDLDGLRRLLEK